MKIRLDIFYCERNNMTVIAFISQKGGVGKSTLSQALATLLIEESGINKAVFKIILWISERKLSD